ncbi:hypothetical protein J7T55_014932 [Diaporthe amygdali]|uniref:uncharacterized protein n=1 Tax=Phomopsis amygdali TaxID=1214568 RepID=UPI0022FDF119|nr:uncharacterized protein J7T55_014932 [Diaporthe amygdali]KAJ0106856.1 hypothetical protein J7T55_014932 [Diaporthe amygdali]
MPDQTPSSLSAAAAAAPPSSSAGAATSRIARHVALGDAAPTYSTWLNDPNYMKLETYFAEDQKAAPGLAASFGLNNLRPVLVKPDTQEGNTYLITDDTSYWMFNELEGRMWKFKNKSLTQSMVVNLVEEERYDGSDLAEQTKVDPEELSND